MHSDPFKMPGVEIGDIVKWYPSAERSTNETDQGYVGMVTSVGQHTININVFSPSSYNFMIRDGVRHMDDPMSKHPDLRSQGGWEHTAQTKRLEQYYDLIDKLIEDLGMEKKKSKKPAEPVTA